MKAFTFLLSLIVLVSIGLGVSFWSLNNIKSELTLSGGKAA